MYYANSPVHCISHRRTAFRGIHKFTEARYLSLSWVTCIQYTISHPVPLRPITVSSFCLIAGLANDYVCKIFVLTFWYAFHITPVNVTCSSDLILLVLLTLIIFDEKHKLCNSSYSSFLQTSLILLVENIFLKTLFSNSLSLFSFARIRNKFHTHIKQQAKYGSVYIKLCLHKVYTRKKFSNSPRFIIQVPTYDETSYIFTLSHF
jgi:hypothetical protein